MKAVILCAGAATQLRPLCNETPKTLLSVAGVPMLRRMMTSLLRYGFDQFVICTGYLEDQVRAAVASWFPNVDVTFVTNSEFRSTHNSYSLWLAREHVVGEPFLLLDGDVVFDDAVIETLVERGPDCLAVRSVGDMGLEEVKVTADIEDRVLAIGKHVPVRSAMGESVGIVLFGAPTSKRFFAALDARIARGLGTEWYESALQQIVDDGATVYGVDIGSRYATEIDTVEDLVAANDQLAERPFDVTLDVRLAV